MTSGQTWYVCLSSKTFVEVFRLVNICCLDEGFNYEEKKILIQTIGRRFFLTIAELYEAFNKNLFKTFYFPSIFDQQTYQTHTHWRKKRLLLKNDNQLQIVIALLPLSNIFSPPPQTHTKKIFGCMSLTLITNNSTNIFTINIVI